MEISTVSSMYGRGEQSGVQFTESLPLALFVYFYFYEVLVIYSWICGNTLFSDLKFYRILCIFTTKFVITFILDILTNISLMYQFS